MEKAEKIQNQQPIHRVVAVVLAAGAARRFGRPKQLEHWPGPDGPTLVERAVKTAASSSVAEVYVVTGNQHQQVKYLLEQTAKGELQPVKLVYNPRWEGGQGYSVAKGVEEILQNRPGTSGILFMLADQPRLKLETVEYLINHFAELNPNPGQAIVIPTYEGRRGNPVIFGKAYFEELTRLEGDTGGRVIVKTHPGAVVELAVNDPAIHEDVDTPEDLAKLV